MEKFDNLGADKVIDYTKEDFTKNGQKYDIIFDPVSKSSFSRCKSSLKQNGRYLLADAGMLTLIRGILNKKLIVGIAGEKVEDIIFLKELIESGKLKSVIDRRYPLEQTAEAHSYAEKGHNKGNVVITLENNNKT